MRKAASELRKTLAELQFDEEYASELPPQERLKYLGKVLKPRYIGSGRHRFVFGVNGHYVVKVPTHPVYTAINTAEWNVFRRRQRAGARWSRQIEPARCCVVKIAGSKLLVMERLTNIHTPDDDSLSKVPVTWPQWVYWVDCAQCGVSTRNGKVVAFDYGTDTALFR